MRNTLLTIILLFASIASFSQIIEPTRFNLDSLHIPTDKQDFKYIRLVQNFNNDPNLFLFTEYTRDGKLTMRATSTKQDQQRLEGPRIDYYENGNKKQESNYVNNILSGKQIDWYENNEEKSEKEIIWDPVKKISSVKIIQFWNKDKKQTVIDGNGFYEDTNDIWYEKGEVKNGEKHGVWEGKNLKQKYSFTENYNEGTFISGITTDKNNNQIPYKVKSAQPRPAKGMEDFYKHIGKTFTVPDIQGLQGKIYIRFVVDKDGQIIEPRILKDLGYGTGEEAIKSIKSYGKWIPGQQRGINVRVIYSIPISIKAPQTSEASKNARQIYNEQLQRSNNPFQTNNNSFR